MSTLYGSDAMGGVVNIITKKIADEWTGSFSHGKTFQTDSQFGNDTTTDFALMGPLVENKLGLSLRGSYYDKEASVPENDTGTFGGAGETMDNQNWSAGAGLTFTPNDNHTIRFDYDMMKQKYDNSEAFVGTTDSYETIYDSQRSGYAETQRMEREQYSLSWEADWQKGKSTVGIHHIETNNFGRSLPLNLEEREFIKDTKTTWEAGNKIDDAMQDPEFLALMPRPTRTLSSKNTTLSAKYEVPLEDHYLVVGTDYLKAEMTDGVYGMNKGQSNLTKEYTQFSLFAEDSWMISDPLTFTVGARYDDHEDFGGHLSPRAYLNYAVNHNWTVKGGISTGYKTPKTSDLYDGIVSFSGQGTSPGFGNPDLKPEESLNKEIAAYYEHDDGHSFNITVFQNDFKDKIENGDAPSDIAQGWKDLGYTPTLKENVGDAEIKGIEIAGKYQIIDSLAVKGNYTFTDSEVESTGESLGTTAKHLYNVTLDWQTTEKWNNYLTLSGEKDRWRGDSRSRGTIAPKDASDLDYWEDYQVFNLGTSYAINDSVTFNGRINNLLDKDFTETITYTNENDQLSETYAYNLAQKRREIWLSMNVTF